MKKSKPKIVLRGNSGLIESPNPHQFGRYLAHYRDLGYVSTEAINCVSRHREYSYQDWCIGSLADRLGDNETAKAFYQSADKLWNLWHDEQQHFAPKTPEGDWAQPFDIDVCRPDSWNDPYFYEGVSRAWIRHEEINDSAELQLELAESPNNWGRGAPPPCPMQHTRD